MKENIAIGIEQELFATVDGTHVRIYEPRGEPSSIWYSHKHHGPGLTYEVGLSIAEDKILWINGPHPAGIPDISVFRLPAGVSDRIPPGKRIIADSGYRGEPVKITTPSMNDSAEVKEYKNRARARHETLNKRIKDFGMIRLVYRHDHTNHGISFEAVCVLVQNDFAYFPLFEM